MSGDPAQTGPAPLRDPEQLLQRAGLTLRPIVDADLAFLRALYGASRQDGHLLAAWPAQQRDAFFSSQFDAQDLHYRRYYRHADFLVLERRGEAIGRLVLDRGAGDWRIVTVELVPEARSQGFGTALLRTILAAAGAEGAEVSLNVELDSKARALYARLGFADAGGSATHFKMVWTPLK